MTISEWARLRDSYPPLEKTSEKEEPTAFENWAKKMGYDGITQITGEDNDKNKKSD